MKIRKLFIYLWPDKFILCLVVLFILEGISQDYVQAQTNGWSTPINFSQQPDTFSGVANIICDPYQILHVFWGESLDQNGVPKSVIFYKNDIGGGWSQPLDLLVTDRFDRLHSAITPDNLIHLVWSNNYNEIMYMRAPLSETTHIRQWISPLVLENDAYNSNISVDKAGTLYLIYTTSDIEKLFVGIYYKTSTDSGRTWSISKTILETNTKLPSYATAQFIVDDRGRFHIVYSIVSNQYGVDTVLGYMRSIDGGKNWGTPLTFPPPTTFQGLAMPAEFSFGNDEIHLTYDIPDRIYQWSFDGGESWSQPIPIANEEIVGAAFGGYNQLVKDSSGVLHVVFASAYGVFHSTWDGISWSPMEVIDKPVFDPHGQQLALCQGNRLSVLYGGNDVKSEIWYSEKMLNISGIPQSPIPTPISTPTTTPTSLLNINISETPVTTKIAINPPIIQHNQSLLSVIIFPASLVIFLICTALFYRIKHP
jgi:hypothetical protein